MRDSDVPRAINILRQEYKKFRTPYVTEVAGSRRKEPFRVLVSCILSLRTKDQVTREATERLFELAATPEALSKLPVKTIEKAIYPAGFYRTKARDLKAMAETLAAEHSSKVPDTIEGLVRFKGVGRKTANLVVTMGHGKPGICVDTHVHRITNRWGYVTTKTPERTEQALREILPRRYWLEINDLLVAYGQNLCTPTSPFCSKCRLTPFCDRRGVARSR